jgi:hypothetical protein
MADVASAAVDAAATGSLAEEAVDEMTCARTRTEPSSSMLRDKQMRAYLPIRMQRKPVLRSEDAGLRRARRRR